MIPLVRPADFLGLPQTLCWYAETRWCSSSATAFRSQLLDDLVMLLSSQWLESQGYLLLLQDDWTGLTGSAGCSLHPGVECNSLLDCTDAQNRTKTLSIPLTFMIIVWAVTSRCTRIQRECSSLSHSALQHTDVTFLLMIISSRRTLLKLYEAVSKHPSSCCDALLEEVGWAGSAGGVRGL
jgi:hypothetical protein